MSQADDKVTQATDQLTELLTGAGYRVEELMAGSPAAILNVFSGGTEGPDGYLYTLTASVTP